MVVFGFIFYNFLYKDRIGNFSDLGVNSKFLYLEWYLERFYFVCVSYLDIFLFIR